MRIGILSDTHSLLLPPKLLGEFKTVDLIIHAGDICDADTVKALQALGPKVVAVQGNMDDAPLKKKLPLKEIIDAEGIKIGVTHGHMGESRNAFENAQQVFKEEAVDVVIFGHSHHAISQKVGTKLFFNPGSPNDVVKAFYFSYGILEINKGKIKAEIVKI